jgi:hypothetical protein
MAKKGSRGPKRVAKKTQKMMKSSCMWGGNSAHYSGSGSGATEYGAAIFGDRGEQTNDGMGSNHIKLNDPSVVWKGGQRGGGDPVTVIIANGNLTYTLPTTPSTDPTQPTPPAQTVTVNLEPNSSLTYTAGQSGGSMLGAAIVPAALLAANQLYKPTRAINNLSFGRKKGFKKTLKKFPKRKR